MDRDVAQCLAMTAARCSKEIGELAILVKAHCNVDDHKALSLAIGSAVFELRDGLMGQVFKMLPELEKEFEDRLKKYGRSYY